MNTNLHRRLLLSCLLLGAASTGVLFAASGVSPATPPPCPMGKSTLLTRYAEPPSGHGYAVHEVCDCPTGGLEILGKDGMVEDWCELLPGRVLPPQSSRRLFGMPDCPAGTFVKGLNPDGSWQGCVVAGKGESR